MRINHSKPRHHRNQAGVTLIEALVSMGIFGVSFFSLYTGMSMGLSIIGSARENLRATQIMVEKTETIRLYSWDQINTSGFIPASFSEPYYPKALNYGNPGIIYNGTVTIGNGPSGQSYSTDLRKVTINLSWTSGGKSHQRSMSTYVAHYGLQNYIY
jgi:hypothetical protein